VPLALVGDGSSLCIANAAHDREDVYDVQTGVAGTPRPVTPAIRERSAAPIRDAIDRVNQRFSIPDAR